MIVFSGVIFSLTLLYFYYRSMVHKYAERVFLFKMYEIRDKLLIGIIHGDMNPNDKEFDILESLSRIAIIDRYYLNLWYFLGIGFKHFGEELPSESSKLVENILSLKNPYRDISEAFMDAQMEYLFRQHVTLRFIVYISRRKDDLIKFMERKLLRVLSFTEINHSLSNRRSTIQGI